MGHFVTPLIYGALAEAAPDEVQADSGMMNLVTFQGVRKDGRPFASLYFASGGFGALKEQDGWPTLPHPSNMAVVPVEVWENLTHTTIVSKRLRPDSGGIGKWRGGVGQEVVLRNDTGNDMILMGTGNRTVHPAKGFFGGGDGSLRSHALENETIHAKGRILIPPGQSVSLIEAGGGGFGDPAERDPEAVREDIANGFVTREAAARDYGWSG